MLNDYECFRLYESRTNGNITDFNNDIKKLSKLELQDFTHYVIEEMNDKDFWTYIYIALRDEK